MKHTDLYNQYRALEEMERRELRAAVEAHGGEYVFCTEDDAINEMEVPIVANESWFGGQINNCIVTRVTIADGYLDIMGTMVGCPFDEFPLTSIVTSHLGGIIDFIPETDEVQDVSGI